MHQRRAIIHEPTTSTVACSLGGDEAEARVQRWRAIREEHLQRTQVILGGIRMWFAAAAAEAIEDLAASEASCCGFLRLAVRREDDAVVLEITGHADAGPLIRVLAGGDVGTC